jgi:dolichol kinase
MTGMERAFPAFATGFAAFYVPAFQYNWAALTYFPALNQWYFGIVPATDSSGPPMYWYGWIVYAILAGIALALVSLLFPARFTAPAWAILSWGAPLTAICVLAYEGRHWFL